MSAPKKKVAPAFKQPPPRANVSVSCGPGEDQRPKLSELITSPEMAALRVVRAAEGDKGFGVDLDMPSLIDQLRTQASAINSGEMKQVEAMLMNQAIALQSLFARLVEHGMRSELLNHLDTYLRLGLRAQAQCSRTLEALAEIKNPPVVFAKTANIAHQQQVNNGVVSGGFSPARESEISPSKLLECLPDERLDFGTPATASRADPQLATLEPVNRPQVASG
ncbi:MAG: hypothetical protein ACOYMW_15605 [Candidatus Competibacteraceae bacterium]